MDRYEIELLATDSPRNKKWWILYATSNSLEEATRIVANGKKKNPDVREWRISESRHLIK